MSAGVFIPEAAEGRDAALKRYVRAESKDEKQRIAQEVADALNAV